MCVCVRARVRACVRARDVFNSTVGMSSEPLEVVQPGMAEGSYVSAVPEPAAEASGSAAASTGKGAASTSSSTRTSFRSVAPAEGPGHVALSVSPSSSSKTKAATEVQADVGDDPEYDPDVLGDFEYPPMPPQECCGCRPPLAPCCYSRRMGRAYVCCERKGPNPKIHLMCGSGWTTQIVTIILVFGISFGAYGFALRLLHWGFLIAAIVVSILACLAISAVGCCDPGVFPRYLKKKEKNWRYVLPFFCLLEWNRQWFFCSCIVLCKHTCGTFSTRYCHQSGSFRPPGIQWCDETGVLIHDIDHFCPWSGTTIAKKNMVWFKLFLAMICFTLIFTVAVVIIAAITQGSTADWPED